MTQRKIVQIAYADETIVALADDGTLWYTDGFFQAPDVWVQVRPLPEPVNETVKEPAP